MFTPSLCRDVGDISEWVYGAHNKGDQSIMTLTPLQEEKEVKVLYFLDTSLV
jgi:hypothetical protein